MPEGAGHTLPSVQECLKADERNAAALSYSFNTLRTGSFKLFKRPFPGFLTISTL